MANIDDKVVAMSFEGSKFESGVRSTLSALDKLKAALRFDGASKGLNDVSNASKRIDFSRMASGIEDIKNRLGALRLAAIAAFTQMAMRAVSAGMQFAKSFTIQPIMQGLEIYQTKLQSIQTVLANTQAQGTKMSDVTKALDELNKYSNQTIYNFGQMAKNIGTFTAAGVDLKTATASIKGIANLAALSGSNSEQASVAMYQLSQAIAAGRVSLQDWNSVVNAGMGGAVFQKALANTAVAMGSLKDGAVQLVGPMKQLKINGESFRESIGGKGPKWLTSDILTTTLKTFTGDLSAAQLKAQGFNDQQIKSIQTTAKLALHAATQVKTLGQVFDIARETMATGWATTFETVFGSLDEAKATFTALSNAINGFIQKSADARNKVLGDWKALGGRAVLITAIKDTFQALGAILAPIKAAFRDIFPAKTGKDLYNLTVQFKAFAEALKPSPETIDNIRRTFRGLFAVLDIGRQIVSGIFTVFGQLFHAVGGGNGSFLKFTASIGDFLVNLDKALKKGDAFHNFFVSLGQVLTVPVKMLQHLGEAIANLFSGFSPGGFSGKMASLTKSAEPFRRAIDGIAQAMQGLGPAISNAISNINWEAILQVVRTGLFAALVLMLKNFIGGTSLNQIFGIMGKNIGKSFGAGILGNMSKAFGGLSGTLSAMQNELKARTLEEIAIAIALLAASVLALSLVNPDRLSGALGAMTIMFGELLAAMAIMDKITTMKSFVKLPVIAASLILFATAIDILTIAVYTLSKLSWEQLTKGLTGVGVLLGTLAASSVIFSKNSAGMVRTGIALMGIAVAMNLLARAMQQFGNMNWTQIAKGLVGVGGALAAIAGAMQLMPRGMVLQSAAILAIGAALNIIALAVAKFGAMNLNTLAKGLGSIGASLVIIAGAMHLMPKSMVITAAGLLLVAASLGKIGDAVQKMGGMSIKQIAKGLVGLAGALTILAVALNAMSGTFAGAAALAVAATGLSLLVPALVLLGRQSWTTLLKGLIGLAAAIAVIAGAALLLSPSIPALLGFGAALVVIGAGLALAGAGIALIGVGLSAIAVAGTASVGILIKALTDLVASLVGIAKNLVLGVLEIVKAFAATAPQFTKALVTIVNNLLDVVIKSAPKIGQAFQALLDVALKIIANNQGKIIQAGFNLILALLRGISNNIGQVVTQATNIIVNFLRAIANNLGRIITAGAQILISLIKGIANAIGNVTTAALNIIVKFLAGIASKVGAIIKAGTDIIVNLVTGIGNAGARIVTAGVNAMIKFINAISKGAVKLIDAGMTAIVNFLNGVAKAINTHSAEMRTAGMAVAFAIADGMAFGLLSRAKGLAQQAANIGHGIISAMKHAVGAHSPSKEAFDIGTYVMLGLANGMSNNSSLAYSTANELGQGVISVFKNVFQIMSPSKVMYDIGNYVGQGFAQGLRGSQKDINDSFVEMNDKLTEAMRTARETIATEQDKLDKLRAAKKPDMQAIKDTQKVIAENQALLDRSTAAHAALIGKLKSQRVELSGLANEYDKVSVKLKKAQDALAAIVKIRDDAIRDFKAQYSASPEISGPMVQEIADSRAAIKAEQDKLAELQKSGNSTPEQIAAQYNAIAEAQAKFDTLVSGKVLNAEGTAVDQLATYVQSLKTQADTVAAYSSTLDQLRKLGLDDATYQKLLSEGPADQAFASQLLAGGKTAVASLNTLDKNLATVSGTLATHAAKNLYQAGVDSAAGIVKGLESKRVAIRNKMSNIAQDIINTLKKELKIKSPSQVMADLAGYAMEGFAKGIFDNSKIMRNAVSDTVKDTMDALRASMKKSTSVNGLELQPVITPVLDLSLVRAASGKLAQLTDVTSYAQASAISTEQLAAEEAAKAAASGTSIKFEQNNYSPESLSEVEIYRQTKNQLSQLRAAFAL
jgi:tape measure domain-containing protein